MTRAGWLVAFLASLVFVLAAVACGDGGDDEKTPAPTPTAATTTPTGTAGVPSIEDLSHAVVQIVALRETVDGYEELWTGSGTIIDPTGLILTNYHVVEEETETESGEILRWDELGVALTVGSDEPPEPAYFAQVLAQDPLLDLAVIQPYTDNEGNTIDPATLDLPTIPVGDATELVVGQQLNILGYPSIGGDTITFSTGRVSGFLSQDGVEERRAWVKTDATAAPGNSGGAALNDSGLLVGVPTRATIDVGGSINRVRPINLAQDVIARARAGEFVARGQRTRAPTATPEIGQVFITGIVFARDVTEDGELIDLVDEFPAGITKLVFAFDYAGMQTGYDWVDEWYVDGVLDERLSGPRPAWNLDEKGFAYAIVDLGDPLPSGEYELELSIEGENVASATTYVGRSAAGPSIGPITFAQDASIDDEPIGPATSFAAGTQDLFAFFDYDSAATVGEYRWVWVWKDPSGRDRAYQSDRYPWEGGESGNWWVAYRSDEPLPGGDYEFELYMDDELVQTDSFAIEGPAGEPSWPER